MRRILFATDGSEHAGAARELLETLPLRPDTEVFVLTVIPSLALPVGGYADGLYAGAAAMAEFQLAENDWAKAAAERTATELRARGLNVTAATRDGDPPHEIIAAARELEVDLVVLGATGATGLEGFLLGSVARNVAKHCPAPVLIARAPRHGLREVVLATDGSEHAQHALRFAAGLPLPEETVRTVVHVVRPIKRFAGLVPTDLPEFEAELEAAREHQREAGRNLVSESAALLTGAHHVRMEIREGDPAREVLALAQERGADLIVAGARGVSLIEGLRFGSVADRLLKDTECSLLIVH